jgi:hypothetical protein
MNIIKNQKKANEGKTDRKTFLYINHDLTPLEQEKDKILRDELKKRRADGETNLIIRNGNIVTRRLDRRGNDGPDENN